MGIGRANSISSLITLSRNGAQANFEYKANIRELTTYALSTMQQDCTSCRKFAQYN